MEKECRTPENSIGS